MPQYIVINPRRKSDGATFSMPIRKENKARIVKEYRTNGWIVPNPKATYDTLKETHAMK